MYSVTIDGVLDEVFESHPAALKHKKRLEKHPVICDRRLFNAAGIIEIIDQDDPDCCRNCGVWIEDCGCTDGWE